MELLDIKGTDELPVLSDEAILAFEDEQPDGPAAPARGPSATARRAATVAAPASDPGELERSLELLRSALESAERRWRELESKLKGQDRAIAGLRTTLDALSGTGTAGETPVEDAPEAARPKHPPPEAATKPAERKGSLETEVARAEAASAMPERIAALEAYIAGRAARWREMEDEVEAKTLRIAELEAELAQRIEREQNLEQRIHDEGLRTHELRDKLKLLNRRLEDAAPGSASGALEPTRPSTRPAGPYPEDRGRSAAETPRAGAAELVCLTSDKPERHVLDKATITIGRGPECDIRVATHSVSRQHARIRRENGALIIEDQASTNGVFVNSLRVDSKTLEHGDWVTIGETQFRFLSGDAGN